MAMVSPCAASLRYPCADVLSKSARRRVRCRRVAIRHAHIQALELKSCLSGHAYPVTSSLSPNAKEFIPTQVHVMVDWSSLVFNLSTEELGEEVFMHRHPERIASKCHDIVPRRTCRDTCKAETLIPVRTPVAVSITADNSLQHSEQLGLANSVDKCEVDKREASDDTKSKASVSCMGRGRGALSDPTGTPHVARIVFGTSSGQRVAQSGDANAMCISDAAPKPELKFWRRICGKSGIRSIVRVGGGVGVCGKCSQPLPSGAVAFYSCDCCGILPYCIDCDDGAHPAFIWKQYRKFKRLDLEPD